MAVIDIGGVPEAFALTDIDKLRPRARNGDADPGDELFDLPSSEIDQTSGRADPWWLMPMSLAMWALVALGVMILMTALVSKVLTHRPITSSPSGVADRSLFPLCSYHARACLCSDSASISRLPLRHGDGAGGLPLNQPWRGMAFSRQASARDLFEGEFCPRR